MADINKVAATVSRLRSSLPADLLEKISAAAKRDFAANDANDKCDYFGNGIKYTHYVGNERTSCFDVDFSWMDFGDENGEELSGSEDSDATIASSGFSMKYNRPAVDSVTCSF